MVCGILAPKQKRAAQTGPLAMVTLGGLIGKNEKAAGQYPAACRAQNLTFENASSAPVLRDLHWRAKVANQKCRSLKGTKNLLRRGHSAESYSSRFNFRFPQ
jgi:hypothetical protein